MPDFWHMMSSWYPIVVCVTTWQNRGRHHTCKYISFQSALHWYHFSLSRPCNHKELFNLRHTILRNVVECILGVLKRLFHILLLPAEYNITIQVWISPALCLIHNVICTHDPDDISDFPFNLDDTGDTVREVGLLASSIPTDKARIHSH